MIQRFLLPTLVLIGMIVSCIPSLETPAPTPTQEQETPFPSPSSLAVPTARSEIVIQELRLIPGSTLAEWHVIGLAENISKRDLRDITLEITLFNQQGDLLGSQTVPSLMVHLGPGEATPFQAFFVGINEASSASAEIISFNTETFSRVEVEVEFSSSSSIEGERESLLGHLSNTSSVDVELSWFGILLMDTNGQPSHLITDINYPRVLESNQSVPFMAISDSSITPYEPYAYTDGIAYSESGRHMLTIPKPPDLFLTDQGLLVALIGITNEDTSPRWFETFLELRLDGETIAVVPMSSSLPLRPGETRFLSIDQFPGSRQLMAQRNLDPDAFTAEIILSPSSSRLAEGTVVALNLEVTHYEPVGSSLILRGNITNHWANRVEFATVFAAVYSTEGGILTSAEMVVGITLAPDEQVPFILPIHLPRGMIPAMSEFDLQAAGFIP